MSKNQTGREGVLIGSGARITTSTQGLRKMSTQSDVKTIHEFLADNPNIDVSKQWERCWNIHGKIADRIVKYFDAELYPEISVL